MAEIRIKDNSFQVSEPAKVAILAERTEHGREIKTLKNTVMAKDAEIVEAKEMADKAKKKLKKLKDSTLLKEVKSSILEVDDSFNVDAKKPYKLMAKYLNLDGEKAKDKDYVKTTFDSAIAMAIDTLNKKSLKHKEKKTNDSKKAFKKYYGGK